MSLDPERELRPILESVERYYSRKFAEHGATPMGVDWNSAESQELRFVQLLKVCRTSSFSIIDYGCGYGALAGFLRARDYDCDYLGYELSAPMRQHAQRAYGSDPRCRFSGSETEIRPADYAVASGIFNVKLRFSTGHWTKYVFHVIDRIARLCTRGFAFNMLTAYSDRDRRRSDLYYADPCAVFDYCKRRHSRDVALLHDYGLFEFTLIVRKDV